MHPLLRPGYAALGHLARAIVAVVPASDAKIIRSLRARRGLLERYEAWGSTARQADRPLLWMHAPSVGEGLQARPVMELLRADYSKAQLAYTHFSPSAERFAASLAADFFDYLPFDDAGDTQRAIDALRPTALVFSKLDLWPNLVRAAARRGTRIGMISATLPAGSRRRSGLGRALLGEAYARLDAVGAIDREDAERLIDLGVRESAVRVTGDTRYDQVWARAQRFDPTLPLFEPLESDRTTIVAGSTWPSDEQVVVPAFARARAADPGLRLVIAPHEPTEQHIAALELRARTARLAVSRLGSEDSRNADVIVVDRVGVLGDLYGIAHIAFVGGGFHAAGLHSVLEPAAFGVPVLFGPRTGGARDPELLVARGGAAVVASENAMAERLTEWVRRPARCTEAGSQARAVVASGVGAARATYDLVRTLLPD